MQQGGPTSFEAKLKHFDMAAHWARLPCCCCSPNSLLLGAKDQVRPCTCYRCHHHQPSPALIAAAPQSTCTHLGRHQAPSADKSWAENALIAQNAIGGVLLLIQELPELSGLGLRTEHLPSPCTATWVPHGKALEQRLTVQAQTAGRAVRLGGADAVDIAPQFLSPHMHALDA